MKKRETYGHQSDAWDKAVTEGPRMRCGRLDLNSYDADDRPFRNVYFEGELEEVACTGHRADFVAYAANRYHDHVATIARLAAENERLRGEREHEAQVADMHARNLERANDRADKAEAERDEARGMVSAAIMRLSCLIDKWELPAGDGRKPAGEHALGLEAWSDLRQVKALLLGVESSTEVDKSIFGDDVMGGA